MPAPFAQVHGLEELAQNLGCSTEALEKYTHAADQRRFYERIRIPKRGARSKGTFRTVFKAEQSLALLQKNTLAWLIQYVVFPPCVQGFVPKRSIATNARMHLKSRGILHADIKDFFDSIHADRVLQVFQTIGCTPEVADALTSLCTLAGRLPQGSSASPAIANIVCRAMDTDMELLAQSNGCRYSRYADDITISGDQLPGQNEVAALVRRHGFIVRDDKCRVQRQGRSQFVTGLTVQDARCPRVPKILKRRLRLELHYAGRYGLAEHLKRIGSDEPEHWAFSRLRGWMTFLRSIEGEAMMPLEKLWRIVEEAQYGPDDEEPYDEPPQQY